MKYIQIILTAICILLGNISYQIYTQRPVTHGEMSRLTERGLTDKAQEAWMRMPLSDVYGEVGVEIQNYKAIPVKVEDLPLKVEIDR